MEVAVNQGAGIIGAGNMGRAIATALADGAVVLEDEAEGGKDAELKSWASGKLAVLRSHLQEAERIQELVKKSDNRNQ